MKGKIKYLRQRKAATVRKSVEHGAPPEIEQMLFPIPVEARGGAHNTSHFYPFEQMLVGDSFWIPSSTTCTAGACSKFAKKTGWKFTVRAQSKDGRKNIEVGKKWRGVRIWRVA